MKWNTIEFDELAEEPIEPRGDISINIYFGETFRKNLNELFDESIELKPEEQIEIKKEKENPKGQEGLAEILYHIGPRIP